MKRRYLMAPALAALVAAPAWPQVTSSYRYDVLGRLVSSVVSGAPSGDKTTTIGYDPASNRTGYKVANGATSTPTPTPAPSAPVALSPAFTYNASATYSIGLSSLATASAPARITAFSSPSGGGTASIAGDGQSVSYTTPAVATPGMCEPADSIVVDVPYTVQNAAGGQGANGTAHITVKGKAGPRPKPGQNCP